MSTVATLWVKLGLDSKGYKDGLNKATKSTSNFTKVAGVALVGVALAGAKAMAGLVKESTLMAARADTLAIVTEKMGENIGLTTQEIRGFEEGIQDMGITTIASREAVAQLIRSQIDLSKSADLARLAQNAAVIAGEDSSSAFKALSVIIATGNTLMARRRGLMVDFVGAYKDLAAQLGKSVDELTDAEKSQARLTEVMSKGKTIAGVYDAAMETAGKQLLSFKRHADELKVALGVRFQNEFKTGIKVVTWFTKTLTEGYQAENLMNEALDKGLINLEDYINMTLDAYLTSKTFVDIKEELVPILEEEAVKTEALADAIRTTRSVNQDYRDSIEEVTTSQLLQVASAEELKFAQEQLNAVFDLFKFSDDVKDLQESLAGLRKEQELLIGDKKAFDEIQAEIDEIADAWIKESQIMILTRIAEKAALSENAEDIESARLLILKMGEAWGLSGADAIAANLLVSQFVANLGTDIHNLPVDVVHDLLLDFLQLTDTSVTWDVFIKTHGTIPSVPGISVSVPGVPTIPGVPAARAFGGPVSAGSPYIVGERGMEMFVPSVSGNIVPNNQLQSGEGANNDELLDAIELLPEKIAEAVVIQ